MRRRRKGGGREGYSLTSPSRLRGAELALRGDHVGAPFPLGLGLARHLNDEGVSL